MDQQTSTLQDAFNELDQFEDSQVGKVFAKNPKTSAPTQFFIEFAGPEHPERKKRVMSAQRMMRQQLQKAGRLQLRDPLEDEQDSLDMLVACALSWNFPKEFSKQAVAELLGDSKKRWLRDQMQAGFDERENFIVRSA